MYKNNYILCIIIIIIYIIIKIYNNNDYDKQDPIAIIDKIIKIHENKPNLCKCTLHRFNKHKSKRKIVKRKSNSIEKKELLDNIIKEQEQELENDNIDAWNNNNNYASIL